MAGLVNPALMWAQYNAQQNYGYPQVSPWQQVSNINMANSMLPAFAQFNPGQIDSIAQQRKQAFMRDFANPYMSRVRSQNSLRSGDTQNSFAMQDNAFEKAEMARQAENVYSDAKANETSRISSLRNSYLGIPTADAEGQADSQYKAMVQEQELARQRRQEWLGPNGYIPNFGANAMAGINYYANGSNPLGGLAHNIGQFGSGFINGLLGR